MAGDENPISVGDGLLQVEVGERHPIAGCADGVALELVIRAIAGGGGASSRQQIFWTKNEPFGGGNHFAPEERHKAKGRLPFEPSRPFLSTFFRFVRPRSEMEGLPAEVVNRRGLYDVTLYRVVHDRSLRQETIFECVLSIPATQYQIARRLIYYPGLTLSFFLLVCLCLESLPEPILSNCVTSSPPRHCINLPPPTRLGLFVPQGEIGW